MVSGWEERGGRYDGDDGGVVKNDTVLMGFGTRDEDGDGDRAGWGSKNR